MTSDMTYEEAKSMMKITFKNKNDTKTHWSPEKCSYLQLDREEQAILSRLRVGHIRLKHHLFNRLKMGPNNTCTCGTGKVTGERTLQEWPT